MAERKAPAAARAPGRPTNRERTDELARTIEQGLHGLAELLDRRETLEDADSFAAVIERDAGRMAEWLAALANNYAGAERAIRWFFGAGSVIGFAGAFGPLVSLAYDKLRLSGLFDFSGEPEPAPPTPAFS